MARRTRAVHAGSAVAVLLLVACASSVNPENSYLSEKDGGPPNPNGGGGTSGGAGPVGSSNPSDGGPGGPSATGDAGRDAKEDANPPGSDGGPATLEAGPSDPSPFRVIALPQASSSMLMRAIWGSDAGNVYFCGDDYPYDGGLWRWNGNSIAKIPSVRGRCNHVAGASANNVWVRWDNVAQENPALHFRFDGAQWIKTTTLWNGVIPIDATTSFGFAGIYNGSRTIGHMTFSEAISGQTAVSQSNLPVGCPSSAFPAPSAVGNAFGPNDVWAKLGDSCIMHWDGVAWTKVQPSGLGNLGEVHGSATNDMWAVGNGTCPIAHWNGQAWSASCAGLPAAERSVYGVYGAPDGKAWAVGSKGVYTFNGASWSSIPVPLSVGSTAVYSVWGSSSTDVWIGGEKGLILHMP